MIGSMELPREEVLPPKEREALRAKLVSRTGNYHPWVHLLMPATVGLAAIVAVIFSIKNLHPVELLTIPLVLLLSNAVEWRAHKDLLHRRSRLIPMFYDRHTPQHHMVFVTDDLAARGRKEWRFVLIPSWGLLMIAVGNLPIAAALYFLVSANVAALYLVTAFGYVLSYEWLHLSYHLPPESAIGRIGAIRFLRRHHATHHDPRLMQRWNFNVTVPLWDLVRGTYVAASARESAVLRPRHGHLESVRRSEH
jgi:hypothetical protein